MHQKSLSGWQYMYNVQCTCTVGAVSPLLYWEVEVTSSPTLWHSVAASVNDETAMKRKK